jgi:hypothetical protein
MYYWSQYIHLEKEFCQTIRFATLSDANRDTFSAEYSKLLLEIGSEVDVVANLYCKLLDSSFRKSKPTIKDYRKIICEKSPRFSYQGVVHRRGDVSKLLPWYIWHDDSDAIPAWWIVYNKVKHDRLGEGKINGVTKKYYMFANQFYTLSALAALYQLLMSIYLRISIQEGLRIRCPLPGSRIFMMDGDVWASEDIYDSDDASYVDENFNVVQVYGPSYSSL